MSNMSVVVGTGVVGAGGLFDITTTATFADGVHTFVATETDGSSLTSVASSSLTVDINPTAPLITSLVNATGIGSPDTSHAKVEISGSGETIGDTIKLYADGNMSTAVGVGTVGAGGVFTITTTALSDGVHSLVAIETDGANFTSAPSSDFNVTVDTKAPKVAMAATATSFNGRGKTTFSGTVSDSGGSGVQKVVLYNGAVTPADEVGVAVLAGGTWSLSAALKGHAHYGILSPSPRTMPETSPRSTRASSWTLARRQALHGQRTRF